MAERPVFIAYKDMGKPYFEEVNVAFTYFPGFAVSQKQKSLNSLHANALENHKNWKILEISTKSTEPLGVRLSAFNLCFIDEETGFQYPLENVFQSSKTYVNGGPFRDMLSLSPKDSKRDIRHHSSGDLVCFTWKNWKCALEPKTMFYDWLYCKSLSQNPMLVEALISEGYNAFTDIEFNPEKSVNCQARSAAIFVSLYMRGQLSEFLNNKSKWKSIYDLAHKEDKPEQLKFDYVL